MKQAKDIEQFKVYSQNMMHESMDITDRLYSRLSTDDVKRIILGNTNEKEIPQDLVEKLIELLQK